MLWIFSIKSFYQKLKKIYLSTDNSFEIWWMSDEFFDVHSEFILNKWKSWINIPKNWFNKFI
jgi:hypothetical protein